MSNWKTISSNVSGSGAVDLPVALKDSVARHQRHLADLAISLRSAGVDETLIEVSVHRLMASYEAELTTAMKASVKEADHV